MSTVGRDYLRTDICRFVRIRAQLSRRPCLISPSSHQCLQLPRLAHSIYQSASSTAASAASTAASASVMDSSRLPAAIDISIAASASLILPSAYSILASAVSMAASASSMAVSTSYTNLAFGASRACAECAGKGSRGRARK